MQVKLSSFQLLGRCTYRPRITSAPRHLDTAPRHSCRASLRSPPMQPPRTPRTSETRRAGMRRRRRRSRLIWAVARPTSEVLPREPDPRLSTRYRERAGAGARGQPTPATDTAFLIESMVTRTVQRWISCVSGEPPAAFVSSSSYSAHVLKQVSTRSFLPSSETTNTAPKNVGMQQALPQ